MGNSTLNTPQPIDEVVLSDVIPSNIVSRQPSEGDELEIEYGEHMGSSQVDQLGADGEASPSAATDSPTSPTRKRTKWKAAEGHLVQKRQEMDKDKIQDTIKRCSYLLGQTDLFKHFVDMKTARDPEYAALLDAQPKPKEEGAKRRATTAPVTESRRKKRMRRC